MRKKLKDPYIAGKDLYEYYFSMGEAASIARLARWALANGKAKPVKKGPFNPEGLPMMGVWKAMWRWASLGVNKNEAYSHFQVYVLKYGWLDDTDFPWPVGTVISLKDWHDFMQKKIRTAWQYEPVRHERFLRENGWI